ncbi:hypothetical protein SAMN05216331_109107 [Porphyromonadaceae bacterium KH3R12]|uniref:hypothetical protein n=1 Tax=Proteiniphilum sp. TaxID=1926877 RepID=UPI00089AB755|nr:hypothetical protein [Proteiniphilum sp.]MDY9918546.1 hypothetical protein [Proteiniphilum sp.]OJV86280.1 MAG: hypothetical protein BGO34_04595 [Bacteroidia bacterium 44-10]SDZ90428.1 hypothetical protein SAMN05216331_109107 [Porphyromonadaceae bacterium KH3R12]
MKTYLVVFNGKSYYVNGDRLIEGGVNASIVDEDGNNVALVPVGSLIIDKSATDESGNPIPENILI